MKTPTKTPAARLLDAARAATPDAPTGVAAVCPLDRSRGTVVVTYRRARNIDGCLLAAHTYEVGTAALSVIFGARSAVLPYLDALLSGCVTRPECERWIAARPAVSAAP